MDVVFLCKHKESILLKLAPTRSLSQLSFFVSKCFSFSTCEIKSNCLLEVFEYAGTYLEGLRGGFRFLWTFAVNLDGKPECVTSETCGAELAFKGFNVLMKHVLVF